MNAPHNWRQECWDAWPFALIIGAGLGLFGLKVWNELKMTRAYDRQAVAQEGIRDAAQAAICLQNRDLQGYKNSLGYEYRCAMNARFELELSKELPHDPMDLCFGRGGYRPKACDL